MVPSHLSEKDVTEVVNEGVSLPSDFEGLDYHQDQVLLRIRRGANLHSIASSLGSMILRDWDGIGWALFSLPAGETVASFLEKAILHQDVLYGQPDMQFEFIEPVPDRGLMDEVSLEATFEVGAEWFEDRLWGMMDIRADEAWEMGHKGSEDVIVAIIDTGVNMDHEAFAHNTFVGAYNATDDGCPHGAMDYHGHGTHVAGTAVNDGRSGKLAGVSWDSPIMPIRAMDRDGVIYTNYLINSMYHVANYVEDNPGKQAVANMSIGGRGYNIAFKDAIDYAAEKGVLLVTSAGNSYKRVISFPSAYNGVVSVAATTPHREKADFSTTGWWNSVGAPGTKTWSATAEDGTYAAWQGTSMASPHVAGAVALLLSEHAGLTPLEVKNQLEQTAHPGAYGPGFTEELGYGIIDVVDMLGSLEPMQYGSLYIESNVEYGVLTLFDDAGNMVAFGATGENEDYLFHALKPGNYTVTLSYYWQVFEKANVVVDVDTTTSIVLEAVLEG